MESSVLELSGAAKGHKQAPSETYSVMEMFDYNVFLYVTFSGHKAPKP